MRTAEEVKKGKMIPVEGSGFIEGWNKAIDWFLNNPGISEEEMMEMMEWWRDYRTRAIETKGDYSAQMGEGATKALEWILGMR